MIHLNYLGDWGFWSLREFLHEPVVIFLNQFYILCYDCLCIVCNLLGCQLSFQSWMHSHCIRLIICKSLPLYRLTRRDYVWVKVVGVNEMHLCLCAHAYAVRKWKLRARVCLYMYVCVCAPAVMCSWHVVNKVSPMCFWDGCFIHSHPIAYIFNSSLSERQRSRAERKRVNREDCLHPSVWFACVYLCALYAYFFV